MHIHRKLTEAGQRFAERREREDNAPRLAREIPDLTSLKLVITEHAETAATAPKHIRRIVVERAPALFEIPCGDPGCSDGGHDITIAVMRALRARQSSFHGEDRCGGSVGNAACGRTLTYEGTAEYRSG